MCPTALWPWCYTAGARHVRRLSATRFFGGRRRPYRGPFLSRGRRAADNPGRRPRGRQRGDIPDRNGYQWVLFALCGTGWLADNMWIQAIAVAMPQLQIEFGVADDHIGFGLSSTFLGMLVGALGWGVTSDMWGRKLAFNMTLLITAVFGALAAFAPNFSIFCLFMMCLGMGVGGNLPVDGTLFLEFVPKQNQKLLTLLSVFWPCGQLVTSVLGYILIPRNSCQPNASANCLPGLNIGWRYVYAVLSFLTFVMFFGRNFLFRIYESPKYLLSRSWREAAHVVLHDVADYNGTSLELTIDDLPEKMEIGAKRRQFGKDQILLLFSRKMRTTTILTFIIWTLVSVGYTMFNGFLPKFLAEHRRGPSATLADTYREFAIISVFGVPGSMIASWMVETPVGRKGTMTISTLGTAASMVFFITITSPAGRLASSCFAQFLQNIMYGVLYAYTPEVFQSRMRSTATGIASGLSRIGGIVAPLFTGVLLTLGVEVPLYLASTTIFSATICMALLPIETKGVQAL